MPDNNSEEDALQQRASRLVTRMKAMINVLEIEFSATPDEIITIVAVSLFDQNPREVIDTLDATLDLLKALRADKASYKFKRS